MTSIADNQTPAVPSPHRDTVPAAALPAHRSVEEILAHPDFPAARRLFVAEHAKVYEAGTFPAQLGADVGRVTALAILVCLYAAYEHTDRDLANARSAQGPRRPVRLRQPPADRRLRRSAGSNRLCRDGATARG